jgi:hypothetical protein
MSVRQVLAAASVPVPAIILTLGLWPFHAPRNDVKWVKEARKTVRVKITQNNASVIRYPDRKAPNSVKTGLLPINLTIVIVPFRPKSSHMMSCYCVAVDVAVEVQEYARKKGINIAFTGSDIRAMGITVYIGDNQRVREAS